MKKFVRSLTTSTMLLASLQACSSSGQSTATLKGGDKSGSGSSSLSALETGTIDASELKLKVYKFAVSTSPLCTTPITIFESTDGEEKDIATGPTFGSGRVDAATYPCVMIEISKVIVTASSTDNGACVKDAEFSDVICNDGQKSKLIDGTSVTCSGSADHNDHVTLYLTTQTTSSGGDNALLPPTSSSDVHSGLVLTSPFIVSGDVTGTLTVSLHNFLGSQQGFCFTSPPPFSFAQ